MRAYAGIVVAIVLTAWSCVEVPVTCSPGGDRCPCVQGQCGTGFTCINETCFDLSGWPHRSTLAGSGGHSAGTPALSMSVLSAAPMSNGAGTGGNAAGGVAVTCAAIGSECTATACCTDSICLLNVCTATCAHHQECLSACCAPIDATPGASKTCSPTQLCQSAAP